jgi:hypothetical protein
VDIHESSNEIRHAKSVTQIHYKYTHTCGIRKTVKSYKPSWCKIMRLCLTHVTYTRSVIKQAVPQQNKTMILTNTHAVLVLEIYATGQQTSSSTRISRLRVQLEWTCLKKTDRGRDGTHLEEVDCECSVLWQNNNRKDKHVIVLVHYLMKIATERRNKLHELLIPAKGDEQIPSSSRHSTFPYRETWVNLRVKHDLRNESNHQTPIRANNQFDALF